MSRKDTTPTFIVDCPTCKAKVAAIQAGRAEDSGFDDGPGEPYGFRLYVGNCPRCKSVLAASSFQTGFDGYMGDDEDVWADPIRVYPDPPKVFTSYRIPKAAVASLTEGSNALQANLPMAACLMFGRALEAVCRDIIIAREPKSSEASKPKKLMLAEGIRTLRDQNVIDERLFNWSQQLHAFRNLAAHPDGDTDPIARQDAEDLKTFVYAIIEYIYDLADRYDEFTERQQRKSARGKRALRV